jgi:FMN phosphatase YigB (HAD superfamily)
MKTIIFDIDGTLTNIWPIEKSVLLRITEGMYENQIEELKRSGISDTYKIFCKIPSKKMSKTRYFNLYNYTFSALLKNKKLPKLEKYPIVDFIISKKDRFRFVYATGGQKLETEYVLRSLGIIQYFDLKHSINKNNCLFSKKTGIPFRKIKIKFPECILLTDTDNDCFGASKAGIHSIKIIPGQTVSQAILGV